MKKIIVPEAFAEKVIKESQLPLNGKRPSFDNYVLRLTKSIDFVWGKGGIRSIEKLTPVDEVSQIITKKFFGRDNFEPKSIPFVLKFFAVVVDHHGKGEKND